MYACMVSAQEKLLLQLELRYEMFPVKSELLVSMPMLDSPFEFKLNVCNENTF